MTEKETTSGGAVWRKRAIASVSVAAAVAAGGIALADSAQAAPTATLVARSAIYNLPTDPNGASVAAQQPVQATFTNDGAVLTAGTFTLQVSGVPASITCAAITIAPTGANGVAAGGVAAITRSNAAGTGTCYFTGTTTLAAGTPAAPSSKTLDFTETVNGAVAGAPPGSVSNVTGTLTQQAFFTPAGANTSVTSNTATTALSAGTAPKATGTTPTGGTFYSNGQSVNVLTPGVPLGTVSVTDQSTNPPSTVGATNCLPGQLGEGKAFCYLLNNLSKAGSPATGVFYNALTGGVVFPAGGTAVSDTYQIAELNGFGVAVTSPTSARAFSDVSNTSPFATAILALAGQNVIQGFADGTFRPSEPVTRQAFAHYLYTLASPANVDGPCPATNFTSAYPDVANNSPFCKSITALDAKNIVQGYTDGMFHPASQVSRQAIASFIWRYYNFTVTKGTTVSDAVCTSPTGFSDVTTSNKFCGDIEFLKNNGISKGYSDGGYHPAANSSRQAVAQLLYTFQQSSQFKVQAL